MSNERAPLALSRIPLLALEEEPLVTTIISNYNYARFATSAVQSVLDQTYRHLEVIICDDGSTDESREIISRLADRDDRVRGIFQSNQGQAAAWNAAIAAARGAVFCFLDPDDEFGREKIATIVAGLTSHPEAGLVCHRLQPVDVSGKPIGTAIPRKLDGGTTSGPDQLLRNWGNWPPTSGICVRAEIAKQLFPMPAQFKTGNGDAYIQATSRFLTDVLALESALGIYRVHESNEQASIRPNQHSVSTVLASFGQVLSAVAEFLTQSGRPDLAQEVRLEKIGMYWEHQLAFDVLSPTLSWPKRFECLTSTSTRIPNLRRRWLWRVLLVLPGPLAKWILTTSWSTTRWRKLSTYIATRIRA